MTATGTTTRRWLAPDATLATAIDADRITVRTHSEITAGLTLDRFTVHLLPPSVMPVILTGTC
jgi:hypothetical protein